MATLYASPLLRSQLQQARESGSECDCRSYSYLALSMMLLAVGSAVTVLSLGDADGRLFSRLGHAWLVGPIFICSGVMLAVKSMLYLRRKSLIRMLLQRQAVFLNLAAAQAEQAFASGQITRTASTSTLPPSYETLIVCGSPTPTQQQSSSTEVPPPTYDEAMFLMNEEKSHTVVNMKHVNGNVPKEQTLTSLLCQNFDNTKP